MKAGETVALAVLGSPQEAVSPPLVFRILVASVIVVNVEHHMEFSLGRNL
jgi:hypothetical protein